MEAPILGLGDESMAVMSLVMLKLIQEVCAAFGHGSDGAKVVGLDSGSDVSPMSEWVDKCHLIHHHVHA